MELGKLKKAVVGMILDNSLILFYECIPFLYTYYPFKQIGVIVIIKCVKDGYSKQEF
jgi:hypothetical protein